MPRGVPNKSKEENETPKTIDHVVTQEDLDQNPELITEGINIGDKIQIPETEEVDEKEVKVNDKKDGEKTSVNESLQAMMDMMGTVVSSVKTLSDRVERIETGGVNDFMKHANQDDVNAASEMNSQVDPRVRKIVEETLGDDFKVELEDVSDNQLGLLFTLTVPDRLSAMPESSRPIMAKEGQPADGNGYLLDQEGEKGKVQFERYRQEDRRSRAVPTAGSLDLIREHCERVRAYIIADYAKAQKPQPEFKLK